MAKLILVLLQVFAFVVVGRCDPSDVYNYMGTYEGRDYHIGLTQTVRGEIYLRCIERFGAGAFTTSIDDLAEWNYVKGQLSANHQCIGCTRNFWTNGKYNQPVTAGNGVVITVTGSNVATKIEPNTKMYRYICESPATTTTTTTTTAAPTTTVSPFTPNTQDPPTNPAPVVECLNDNDVIVLLDSSGSIGSENYKKEKVFAYDLARAFQNKPTNRFGFTIFSSSVRIIAPLDHTLSASALNLEILNADYMSDMTNTDLAIDSAVAEFAASTRTVTQNLVIITDGESNNPSATLTSITNAIGQGIRTFAVGIGSGTNDPELLALAGGNSKHMFTSSSFDTLTELRNLLRDAVCESEKP